MNQFLGRQLSMTSKAFRAEFDARLSEVGGSLSTWIVLRSAEESAGTWGLSQKELAERMGVEGPTLVRHLDRLEREGLIQRCVDARDRRVTRIAVTPAGSRVFDNLRHVADAMDEEVRSLLGSSDYDVVLEVLDRLQKHMTRLAGERKANAQAAQGV